MHSLHFLTYQQLKFLAAFKLDSSRTLRLGEIDVFQIFFIYENFDLEVFWGFQA